MSGAADKQGGDEAQARPCQTENQSAALLSQKSEFLRFGSATGQFKIIPTGSVEDLELPISWDGLAVSQDGNLLLSAKQLGVLEYSRSGQLLSAWRPPKQNGEQDFIDCVTVLSDGRVAAGLRIAKHVVILRRDMSGGTWLVDRQISVFQSNPLHLSACGDLLAVAEGDGDTEVPQGSADLVVVSTSSGQLVSRQQREYDIGSVVLTASTIITKNDSLLVLPDSRHVHVVDAYNHGGDQKLWRFVPDNIEYLWDMTVSLNGGVLYLAAELDNDSRVRVAAVSMSDGSRLLDNALCYDAPDQKVARSLALAGGSAGHDAFLVLLDWDGRVSLHPSCIC